MAWYHKYASYHGFSINSGVEKEIVEFLNFNVKHKGKPYCPKKSVAEDNVCPCKELRDNGVCLCNFFVKRED